MSLFSAENCMSHMVTRVMSDCSFSTLASYESLLPQKQLQQKKRRGQQTIPNQRDGLLYPCVNWPQWFERIYKNH